MAEYLNLDGLQTLWTKLKNTFALKKHSHTVEDIPVDSTLSSTSENPVQNKVVNTALSGKSDTSHAHGLSNSSFYGTCANKTTDDGWKMLDPAIDGKTGNYNALRVIRFNANAPAWGIGRYGSGIMFGGADTKALISIDYNDSRTVKFAGGSGSKPGWWFGITGTSGKIHNIDNLRERYSLAYHRNSTDNKQWTKIAWHQESNYPTGDSWNNSTAVLNFYQNSYGGNHLANLGRLMLQSYWGHSKVAEGGTPYSFKTSGTKNAYWQHYVPAVCFVGDYTTYNSGRLNVKIVCSDDTIEWWVANCIWDTSLQFDVLYKYNINLSGNGSGSVIMTNDEFNEYCEDKLVRDVTLGDGTTASSAVKATQDASGNVITATYAQKSHTHAGTDVTSAVNYAKMQEAELLDNTKDIVTEIKKINTRCVKWYRWNETSRPTNAPTNSARCLMQAIVQYENGTRITLVAYPQDTSEYYYIAHYAGIAATTITWRTVYTVPTSSYSSTGTRAVNGTAVASAISGKANAASVTGATKCKVTYNSQGVITAGADLAASDIPNLAASKITSGTFADERIASSSKWNAKQDDISDMIPTAASASNPLCDKAYADAIGERLEARYLGCNANGDPFATHAALTSATKFYYQGVETTPDTNDITTVVADEDHKNTSNVAGTTRYRYGGVDASGKPVWAFEYVINNTGLSQAQLLAVNSGITATKVGNYDSHIADTTKHITAAERTAWNGKQSALTQGTNITISGNTISAVDTKYNVPDATTLASITNNLT